MYKDPNSVTSVTVLMEMIDVTEAAEIGTVDEALPRLVDKGAVCECSMEGRWVVGTVIGADLSAIDLELGPRSDELSKSKEHKKESCRTTGDKHL